MSVHVEYISIDLSFKEGTRVADIAKALDCENSEIAGILENYALYVDGDQGIGTMPGYDGLEWARGLRRMAPVLDPNAHIVVACDEGIGILCITPRGLISGDAAVHLLRKNAYPEELEETSRFTHDCKGCVFLGRDVPKHQPKSKSRPWQLQYFYEGEWRPYTYKKYRKLRGTMLAAQHLEKKGVWVSWTPLTKFHPALFRAVNVKTGEIIGGEGA